MDEAWQQQVVDKLDEAIAQLSQLNRRFADLEIRLDWAENRLVSQDRMLARLVAHLGVR